MSYESIVEQKKDIPVSFQYDLVVVGAGMGGVAAALSASRHGLKTLLVDKMYLCGGLATLGLISIYLPLCDGMGRQVCFGLNDELLRLSIKHGYEDDYPDTWLDKRGGHDGQRFEVGFNPNVFAISMEDALSQAGCDILYGTSVVGAIRKDDKIECLIIENINGRQAINVRSVIDATGDAIICSITDTPVLPYGKGNKLAAWFYETVNGKNQRHMYGAADLPSSSKGSVVPDKLDSGRYSGLDAFENSKMMLKAHKMLLEKFLEKGPQTQNHSLSSVPMIPQLRMTRRLEGKETMDEKDSHQLRRDSVGLINDWRKCGPVYEVPFGCLFSERTKNLASVGRCISVSDGMWDITRVIPSAVVTGQAAGTAFSLTEDLNSLDISELQETLSQDGVVLHEQDLHG